MLYGLREFWVDKSSKPDTKNSIPHELTKVIHVKIQIYRIIFWEWLFPKGLGRKIGGCNGHNVLAKQE